SNVNGWLTKREVECLALFAACPTADGEILEIGTFQGKSAIVLAKASALSNSNHIVAVDPFVLKGPVHECQKDLSAVTLLRSNLQRAGVASQVEFHEAYSHQLCENWDRPIRLLWIDGDHTFEGAKADFDLFSPYLANGAIIAFHDILHPFQCVRAFRQCVVESPHFGLMGMCGSIGWAQYSADPLRVVQYAAAKKKLSRQLQPLEEFKPGPMKRVNKMHYKLRRWFVPHRAIGREHWAERVA
ncbi:MAG: class I SAM-dependent methyltransferase, partial [Planctomycetales bacterium]